MKIDPNSQPSIIPRINEKNEGKVIGIDVVEERMQCSEDQQNQEISLKLQKFSLGLRKFRNLSENFQP